MDSVKRNNINGNQYLLINGLYPTLTIELSDELKDDSTRIWSTSRLVGLSKLNAILFVKTGKTLLEKFKTLKDLFGYQDGVLLVNKDLAWENREILQADYGKVIMLLPSVVDDPDNHIKYEGISFMINELSNYAKITYEEFESMVGYIEKLDFDSLAIQLVNMALLMRSNQPVAQPTTIQQTKEITEVPVEADANIDDAKISSTENSDTTTWRSIPSDNNIPESLNKGGDNNNG